MHSIRQLSLGETVAAWRQFGHAPQVAKDRARFRVDVLREVEQYVRAGMLLMKARELVAGQLRQADHRAISPCSIAHWQNIVAGAHPQDWLALLVPHYAGRTSLAWIDPDMWVRFKTDFLRPECPSAASCYARLGRLAIAHDKGIPSLKTFLRRLDAEMPMWRQARRSGSLLQQLDLFP